MSAAPDPDQKYWAFISYSQRDAAWAQRLHAQLESYRVPRSLIGRRTGDRVIPRRLIPVFRDRSELASSPDLVHEIRAALQSSRSLIVICSPNAAASRWVEEEIRTFKALGRGEQIFPLMVDGEPNAPDGQDNSPVECFAPSLRFDFGPDGSRAKRATEPIAADARAGKDGWKDACLKLIAGLLNVGFDELRRRELRRQRHRRLGFAMAVFAGVVTIGLGYVGLADADVAVWGSASLQRQLDRHGWSLFRRIPGAVEIFQASDAGLDRIRRDVLAAVSKGPLRKNADVSVWEVAQVSAAVLRDPKLSPVDFRIISPMLDRVFTDIDFQFWDGKRVGWADLNFWPNAETVLWMIIALSAAHQRTDLTSEEERIRFAEYLSIVEEMAESYYPLRDGGWNMFSFGPPTHHYVSTAGLALHTLLQLHSTGLCWRGDCNTLKKMITDTARWLTEAFVDEGEGAVGWRRLPDDELPVVSDLSISISGSLVRAHLDVGVPLPDRIVSSALQQLTEFRLRSYHPAYQEITDGVKYADSEGRTQRALLTMRVMWYPWAIEEIGRASCRERV